MSTIDEFQPIKTASSDAQKLFKQICELEKQNLHRDNPQIDDAVINLIKDAIK